MIGNEREEKNLEPPIYRQSVTVCFQLNRRRSSSTMFFKNRRKILQLFLFKLSQIFFVMVCLKRRKCFCDGFS